MSEEEIANINNLLSILEFDNLSVNETEYLNAIYSCNEYVGTPCFLYTSVAKIIKLRNLSCIESAVNKLQDISTCNGCNIDFVTDLLSTDINKIWTGVVNGC